MKGHGLSGTNRLAIDYCRSSRLDFAVVTFATFNSAAQTHIDPFFEGLMLRCRLSRVRPAARHMLCTREFLTV